ncbi:hypothetical protein OUZ56_021545 [Daphnia magna]|uniref:Uncharacterized protein n=1 Tax=Daphnia magna TaxID=35525 RepID=A0ABQ9ZHQ1_9CRUS|nr:hypothetical protein OUZ56_021545 [Daphnia magna]
MIGKGDVITEDESADENVEENLLQSDEHADVDDETETVENNLLERRRRVMANMARENECNFLCLLMSKNEVKFSSDLILEGLFAKEIENPQEFREVQKLWNTEIDKLQEAPMLTRDWQEQKTRRDEKIKELKKSNRLNSSSKKLAVDEFSNLQ